MSSDERQPKRADQRSRLTILVLGDGKKTEGKNTAVLMYQRIRFRPCRLASSSGILNAERCQIMYNSIRA